MGLFDAIRALLGLQRRQPRQPVIVPPPPACRSAAPEAVQAPSAPVSAAADPLFWGPRTALSKRIITEQVQNVGEHYFKDGVELEDENAHWMRVPRYRLPKTWKGVAREVELLIVFPTDYPRIPPIGFYLRGDIQAAPGSGHLYTQAYHNAAKRPLQNGWMWYCVYINPGSWQPAPYERSGDWRKGDSLWEYLTLIQEALTDVRG
jgi:hypothetical protein